MYFASINGYMNDAIVIAIDIYRLSPYVVGASLMHLSLFLLCESKVYEAWTQCR